MKTRIHTICACTGLAMALAASSARANLLVDPGFENNALTSYINVLNNFPGFQGVWGVEAATISLVDGPVVPPEGIRMLRMVSDGLIATQAFQTTDVNSYAGLIDSGAATVQVGALFNANVQAAAAGMSIRFFSSGSWASPISAVFSNLTLDSNPATWEPILINTPVPVGTRWLVTEWIYNNASLQGQAGYVDAARLVIVPEPATLGLLTLGGMAIMRRRGRKL